MGSEMDKQLDSVRATAALAIATLEAIHEAAGSPMKGQAADPIATGCALLAELSRLRDLVERQGKALKLGAFIYEWALHEGFAQNTLFRDFNDLLLALKDAEGEK